MRSQLKVLALALSLSAMSVPHLSAQPPGDLPPRVELQDAFVVGSDLAATLSWSSAVTPPPAGARLKLLDGQGAEVGSVSFAPLAGGQTVWIPGGALPQSSSEAWPLERQFVLVDDSSREILVEKGASVFYNGPVVILAPRWPLPLATEKICTLYVNSLTCHDSEDRSGDETLLDLGENGYWFHKPVDSGNKFNFYWPIVLCDTCKDIRRTITFDLWDLDDPGFPVFDPDDFLGSAQEAGCSPVDKTITYQGRDYTYWLNYHVTCYDVTCP